MTVSITASRGSNHQRRTFVQRLTWIPDHDDGSTFTPGHWQAGEPEELAPGASATGCFTDDDGGLAFHVYQEPLEAAAEAEAEAPAAEAQEG